MSDKYSIELGHKVRSHLISLRLEQPRDFDINTQTKIDSIAKSYSPVLQTY